MSTNFHFCKKSKSYIWENDLARISIFDIAFQPHDEYAIAKNENDIMYLYYTLSIYTNKDTEKTSWHKVASVRTYDFPTLLQLKQILREFIFTKPSLKEYRKFQCNTKGTKGSSIYGYEMKYNTQGFQCDDFYEITRTIIKTDDYEKDSFSLYVGASKELNNSITTGIRIDNLSVGDLKALYDMIELVIKDMIIDHNIRIRYYNKHQISLFTTSGNRVLKRLNNQIDEIFEVGDEVEVIALNQDIDSEEFDSSYYMDALITDVTPDKITLCCGYEARTNTAIVANIDIPLNRIVEIFYEPPKNHLEFDEYEIGRDYISHLTPEEKEEFKTWKPEELCNKWENVLLNRYWMCRDEHNFPLRTEEKYENAVEAAKVSIAEMKKILMGWKVPRGKSPLGR